MTKKILFGMFLFVGGFASAQTFDLMDHYDVSIDGVNHAEYGNGLGLSETKFHVRNLTGNPAKYKAKAYEMSNPTAVDLQICFGATCKEAYAGTPGAQTVAGSSTIPGNAIDSSFKVAPMSFGWSPGDSAIWRVTVYDSTNVADSSSSVIKWKYGVAPNSIVEVDKIEADFNAYPNPASSNLTIDYNVVGSINNSTIEVFDVLGKSVKVYQLMKNKGKLMIDVSDFKSGVYFYTIYADNNSLKTKRVIIK